MPVVDRTQQWIGYGMVGDTDRDGVPDGHSGSITARRRDGRVAPPGVAYRPPHRSDRVGRRYVPSARRRPVRSLVPRVAQPGVGHEKGVGGRAQLGRRGGGWRHVWFPALAVLRMGVGDPGRSGRGLGLGPRCRVAGSVAQCEALIAAGRAAGARKSLRAAQRLTTARGCSCSIQSSATRALCYQVEHDPMPAPGVRTADV